MLSQTVKLFASSLMLLPVVCPLLITPGQCAEFVYKESEDLADLQAITPPSENIIVCIYLCGQFLKNRKVANSDENYRCAATTIRALGAFKPSPIRENALTCYTDIKNPETVMQALTITCELFRDCILQTSQPAMVGVPDDASK